MHPTDPLRSLPPVNTLGQAIEKAVQQEHPAHRCFWAAKEAIAYSRQRILAGAEGLSFEGLVAHGLGLLCQSSRRSLRRVINGTGIVLHTNLGRSPMSKGARDAVNAVMTGYCNLELDLKTGKRGSRYSHVEKLLTTLTGAEAALVVNNNAAAVLLALDTLAQGKEVVVSRGELVEIGGSFRVPDICKKSGATMVEVGTTNRTRLSDYASAITENTGVLLKVHTSNYRVVGFTENVAAKDLADLAKSKGVAAIEDLGSGFLADLQAMGVAHEPGVLEAVASGMDVVTFSGDKLLGGPQCGIIIGKKQWVDILKKNPLTRAFRIDKLSLAALEGVLLEYHQAKDKKMPQGIPTLDMLSVSVSTLEQKAQALAKALKQACAASLDVSVQQVAGEAGGGSLPGEQLPSWGVALSPKTMKVDDFAVLLRRGEPALLGYIADGRFWLDVRTIFEEELPLVAACIKNAIGG